MSILLVDPDEVLGPAIAEHLLGEGDEVRVLTPHADRWQDRGVYVATGDPLDADLVERACTNVRTVVLIVTGRKLQLSMLDPVLSAAATAGTDRVVVCVPAADPELLRVLSAGKMSYVVLVTGRRGFLPKVSVDPVEVAVAVSAADDLAGRPELTVDLASEAGRKELRLV